MFNWIVVCMIAALIRGNKSNSQYDDDDYSDSQSVELTPETYPYMSDTHATPTPRSRVIKKHQALIQNKIKNIKAHPTTTDDNMAMMYTKKHKWQPANSKHHISDLILKKDTSNDQLDSLETYIAPATKNVKVKERRKKLKSTLKPKITRTTRIKKRQEHSLEEYNSEFSDDKEAFSLHKILPKLVTAKQVTQKKKRGHETKDFILNESELDASNNKFLSKMKREKINTKPNRVTKKSNLNKRTTRQKPTLVTKTKRQSTTKSGKIRKHEHEPKLGFMLTEVEPKINKNKPNTKNKVIKKNKHEKHKQKQKPESAVHLITETVRQGKKSHKVNNNHSPEPQMNSLDMEDAMAKPNGLLKPFEVSPDLKDEFTLTVVDMNETPKQQKTVYQFRDEVKQVPAQITNNNQNNFIPPPEMLPQSEQAKDYAVPLIPIINSNNNNPTTTLKPVEPMPPHPEVEIGIHDVKNEYKQNTTVQNSKKDKVKNKSKEAANDDVSKAELYLTDKSSAETDDDLAFIGYLSDKRNRGKKLKDLLRDVSVNSNERTKSSRKSWLSCLGKKALKICIKSCNTAYKNVCKRLKCSTKAKKDLKSQCKKSCKKVFKLNGSKSSDSDSDSDSSRSSDSSF